MLPGKHFIEKPRRIPYLADLNNARTMNMTSSIRAIVVTRAAIDLEKHWGAKSRPYAAYHPKAEVYEKRLEDLLDQHPVPDDYADVIMKQASENKANKSSNTVVENIKPKDVSKF